MTPHQVATCPLGFKEEILSAWRDGLLDQDTAARVAAHAPTCAACRASLANFDGIGHVLRAQRAPDLRAQVWQGLLSRLAPATARRRNRTRGALAGGALAAIAAIGVVALFAALLAGRVGRQTTPGAPIATTRPAATQPSAATATATITPVGPTITAPAGWTLAQGIGSGNVPRVAFAPSDPQVGYGCIVTPDGHLIISRTKNGGTTWQVLGQPVTGQFCHLSINPTDAQDVALSNGSDGGPSELARSRDGGASWQPQYVGTLSWQAMGWAGSTLFVTTQVTDSGGPGQTQLWRSVGGQPFTELDQNGAVSGQTLGQVSELITGHGSTVLLQSHSDSTASAMTTLLSHDDGNNWTAVPFSDGGQSVSLAAATPDGQTLVGVEGISPLQLAISRDDGQTWQRLPTTPATMPDFNALFAAPDGTIIAVSSNNGKVSVSDPNLYTLAPGAAQWTSAPLLVANVFPVAISVDASGQPLRLWASYAADDRGSAWALISHPL